MIDEAAAAVVRRIFALALGGRSCRQIAALLNQEQVPAPAAYAGLLQGRGRYNGLWSAERISEMLQNPVYIGHMAQGKSRRISYKSDKCTRVDKSRWIIVQDTHAPLVSREVFDRAGMLLCSRKRTRTRTYDHPLKGMIFCRECGHPLALVNRPNAKGEDTLYFICRTYQRDTKARACSCHAVKAAAVTRAVQQTVSEACGRYMDRGALEETAAKALEGIAQNGAGAELTRISAKIAGLTAHLDSMYMDKLSGLLEEKDFARLYGQIGARRRALEQRRQAALRACAKPEQIRARARDLAERFVAQCSRELLVGLIERIELTREKQVYIYFRFRQGQDRLQ